VHEPTSDENALPGILRGWFGSDAGAPGSASYVVVHQVDNGWELGNDGVEGKSHDL
jgi:hypothetical protein